MPGASPAAQARGTALPEHAALQTGSGLWLSIEAIAMSVVSPLSGRGIVGPVAQCAVQTFETH